MMKHIRLAAAVSVSALAFASALVSSAAHAQSPRISRADVNRELSQLQAAGYEGEKTTYPNKLQMTEARIQATSAAQSNNATSGYGGVAPGSASQ
ncbi:DUF4148 domain-containing protein [Paraburkholderia solisilvae]|nr:DUF4148 domain-containing protein [Paraburkholderia solisilvae]